MAALTDFVLKYPRLLVLTGAGLSAPSGIPVYRDKSGTWLRTTPVQHNDFLNKPASRQRYWARSMVGWPRMAQSAPNAGHVALARMEQAGLIDLLVTQNVDCLHQRAGHRNLIDLHGSLDRVHCLDCAAVLPRALMQQWLQEANPNLANPLAEMRPDGDADLADELIAGLIVPACPHCGGVLKPDVVFFGGTVPRTRVDTVNEALRRSDALLVVGSSLTVFSGFRFCRDAHQLGKPIAALNQGVTRADDLLTLKVEEDCAVGLAALVKIIGC
ncbi:MAG: NAD-dependent protein deacetylase [Gammaproteobacteria bacterium]|nr:NAD-dependent protein deacetylase [Gammaproteobacteria bacterium]MDP2141424.1 NAD-dependent protein deacetylase [Gammaproteobacteria bacterium]MDP2346412.1 NAD-dependent protein deacetylase [Gammaproteobacteria bacterium]